MSRDPCVAAAVVVADAGVLLVRRAVAEGSLVWQFPAGKVEPGEVPEVAAVREALEETGVSVRAERVLGERFHPQSGRHMVYVGCEVVSGSAHAASPREVSEVAWSSLPELDELVPEGVYGPVREYLQTRLTLSFDGSAGGEGRG